VRQVRHVRHARLARQARQARQTRQTRQARHARLARQARQAIQTKGERQIILLCCPVLNPQIIGVPLLAGAVMLNESVVQSPTPPP
jgi:hypothetical protein